MRIKKLLIKTHLKLSSTAIMFWLVVVVISNSMCEGRALAISLNSTKQKLSIETNSIQRHIKEVIAGVDKSRSLKRVYVLNRTVTCNDGSQSGFYLRKSSHSKKWVVFLEGGWHCYDTKSCRSRWMKLRHLMTSAQWPETRDVGGILSSLPEENPYWHNANHVLIPYCSSDSWSGTKAQADTSDGWRFMGSLIIRQVISDLIPLGLGRPSGSELLLVGSSAGGLGVMLNLDRISNFLHNEKNLKVLVRGISDSGWFLDREPYTPSTAIGSAESVRQGWKMWGGLLPEACVKQHQEEPWRCYFGYRLYPSLKSSLFVFQWIFDEAQMRADNVGAPVTPQQWNYIHDMGGALRSSLDNVTAVFAPSCIGHAVLSKRDWVYIKIDDISLPEALRCWEHTTRRKRNKLRRASEQKNSEIQRGHNLRHRHTELDSNSQNVENRQKHNKLTKQEREERRRQRNQRKRNNNRKLLNPENTKNDDFMRIDGNSGNGPPIDNQHKKKRKNQQSSEKRRGGRKNNNNKRINNNNNNNKQNRKGHRRQHQLRQQQQKQKNDQLLRGRKNSKEYKIEEPLKCSLRLLERCTWPQCNHSCPSFTNPLTGVEMRFLELLTSFGLDIEAVAAALGVDMQTLNNMDHTELVNLLTQQVS